MALLNDIGDTLGAYNHPDVAAAILKPFVSEELHLDRGAPRRFPGLLLLPLPRDARETFRGHSHFEARADFCRLYDQAAFDPDYDAESLEYFEPMLRRVLAHPIKSMFAKAVAEN